MAAPKKLTPPAEPAEAPEPAKAAAPMRDCGNVGKHPDGDAWRVRCDCGTDLGGLSWPEACDIADGHRS